MFLLYVDENDTDDSSVYGRRNREIFRRVFEDISDTAIAHNRETVERISAEYPKPYNTIVVCFGTTAAHRSSPTWTTLPLLDIKEDAESLSDLSNMISVLKLVRPNEILEKKTLTCEDNSLKTVASIVWPLWDYETVVHCRRNEPTAVKAVQLGEEFRVLYTNASKSSLEKTKWVSFGVTANSERQFTSLTTAFRDALGNNPDALLLVHWRTANEEDRPKRSKIKQLIRQAGKSVSRIVVVASASASKALLAPTSFYIDHDTDEHLLERCAHFAGQIPIIASTSSCAELGLPSDYAMSITCDVTLPVRLKEAMHIAKTTPTGYHLLRRETLQKGRQLFAIEKAIKTVRKLLIQKDIREIYPHTDDSLAMNQNATSMIGLHDYVVDGWFDKENHALAPQFPIDHDDIVVDVGCGTGGFSAFVAQYASELVGCDVNPDALKAAEENVKAATTCSTRWLQTTGEDLDLGTDFADKVICTEVLEHVDDPERVMQELFRIGKPGSRYLISVPDALNEHLQKPVAPPAYFEKPNHIRIFERDDFKELVGCSGLEIIDHQTRGFHATFEWLLKWFDDPMLEHQWAVLWSDILKYKQGLKTKSVLDQYIAKSQTIIAQKPNS